ncbi:MAG: CoA activase [Ignavibacteria bacterium]|nr:acyl-CoA dehydratase activase-related protein [Ignavibacteria bacterium]MCC7159391.1 CoA activase [Ignavibacteria bacterium]
MTNQKNPLYIGFDVGSTTVKAVVMDITNDKILWSDYQRHDTKQPEKSLELLKDAESKLGKDAFEGARIFITGSGGSNIGRFLGAKFVQEVNAVSLAVEKFYPKTLSVIELGGQDAKIIVFKEDPETGKKKKIPSMNDKCAGGTGAVIDKINAKLKIPADELCNMGYNGIRLHPVAGKCGVFAETDINGLQKSGVPADELMASLFESIIQQNLSVLTRGHTLRPEVLLLGGPNCYIKGMMDCWRSNIPKMWDERNVPYDKNVPIEELIRVPENAQYFAAIGAIEYGKEEEPEIGVYKGYSDLEYYINVGRGEEKKKLMKLSGGGGLYKDEDELARFREKFKIPKFTAAAFKPGEVVKGFIGLDGGSTSTKAALISLDKQVLVKSYQLSKGNPIEDTVEILQKLRDQVEEQGATLEVLGIGTTGYAKDILKDVLHGDVALVETVAHTQAALHFYSDTDVIVDVGGQDIKLIILDQGRVTDFKLNTQCSAGNGYFLQSTAQGFGYAVEDFAEVAFSAKQYPTFGYGCAVFMQSDIVDFQRQGWKPEEIMAGLANVLPKNIWLYVSQIPNLAKLGRNFVLQGGTQHNLAAVKTQVDFITDRFKGSGIDPNVFVHKHTGEAGAIGCGIEAARLYDNGMRTQFIGLDKVARIMFKTTRNESTRCYFCKNKCLRTFIDVATEEKAIPFVTDESIEFPKDKIVNPDSKVPIVDGTQRLIIATCEKGTVEDLSSMKDIKKGLDAIKDITPNIVEIAATEVWKSCSPAIVKDEIPVLTKLEELKLRFDKKAKAKRDKRVELMKKREKIVIGIPRALNMYQHTPFFTAYFEALGIKPSNIVYSEYTSEELYKEGAKRGAIDPCFPSKIGIPHIHNLMYKINKKKKLDYIFFPVVDTMPSDLIYAQEHHACPTVTATSEAVKAAFIKEGDIFKEFGIEYVNTYLRMTEEKLCARQMFEEWKDKLGLSEEENNKAVDEAFKAYYRYVDMLKKKSREALDMLEKENKLGIVILARPYHNDPGVNHEILEEFQKLGYPVFFQDCLPTDEDMLERLFGDDVKAGLIKGPMDVGDVWKNSYSENTTRKVWAAKYTSRHPNLVALELSSFKCGHDAPIYTVVEEIVSISGTPYFSFKDIDENKPTGSIKIRVETIHYFLKRYREDMVAKSMKLLTIEEKMKEFEDKVRKQHELQKKLNAIHKAQGTGQYHTGSKDGNAVEIDLSKVKKGVSENSETKKIEETEEVIA